MGTDPVQRHVKHYTFHVMRNMFHVEQNKTQTFENE